MNVVVIDYGMGNVASVQKALDFLKIPNQLSSDEQIIRDASHLVLPGVGSFWQGMQNLESKNLISLLQNEVTQKQKPIFGICLGMQLLADKGSEPLDCRGLGIIGGEVVKIEDQTIRVPHLGWNDIKIISNSDFLHFDKKDFYFIHSYHFKAKNANDVLATVEYGNEYTAALKKKNVLATQFHPEKSQNVGLEFIKKFFLENA